MDDENFKRLVKDFKKGIADIISWLLNGGNAKKVDKSNWKQFAGLDWKKAASVGSSCIKCIKIYKEHTEFQINVITPAKPSKTTRLKSIVTPTKKYIASLVQIIGKNVLLCATMELQNHKDEIDIKSDQIITYGATFTRNSNKKIEGIKINIYIQIST